MPYEYGLWFMVIVNTAIFVIFAFSFFKPKSKIDWTAFGGFSAFLVALFTEMYGFPLTLFFIAPWLERNFPGINPFGHDTGILWNVIFGIEGGMMSPIHLVSTVIVAVGMIMIANAWSTLYKAHKEGKLATTGLYSYVRHPQYDGFLLVMIGYLLMWPTIITLLMFPVLVVMYVRLAKKEEKLVEAEHGEVYEKYKEMTPAFIPDFLKLRRSHSAESPA